MSRLRSLFRSVKCPVIGMIHVKALPASPGSKYSVQQLVDFACAEASLYQKYKLDGILVENMFDVPYLKPADAGPELTAVMTKVCTEVKRMVSSMPCGVQILAGNNHAALAVALAAGFQFIRAEGFVFAHVADEGTIEACAGPLLRYRKVINAPDVLIFSDIKKKHSSHAITGDLNLVQTAKAAEFFLSDGIILTGSTTGEAPSAAHARSVQSNTNLPVLAGSGINLRNIEDFLFLDGVIVGSHFKLHGRWEEELDPNTIASFVDKVEKLRNQI